jgi:hypothetical protein
MRYAFRHPVILLPAGFFLLRLLSSCANMASPNGGPYDENPPRFVSSTPALHQTNYRGKKIEIVFDELIQIDRPSENVIITPPQKNLPVIRPAGKKVTVELKDTLIRDMTYTLDFTSSISDNNEKNVIENFTFAFSTGDAIDSLEISGVLLNAENLEPMPGIMVGLHRDLADSAFTTVPFLRTSKTNDRGQFTIRNIMEGSYRLYALNDVNRDYLFDQPGEEIAFHDSIVIPSFEFATRQDTVWRDSLTVDTIRTVGYTRFLPDDIVLRLFREKFQRQYMLRPERSSRHLFSLRFNAPADSLPPAPELLDDPSLKDWYLMQTADGGTALHYWITDSLVWQKDTLHLKVTYLKSDSLNMLQPQTDTLHLSMRRQPPAPKRKSRKDEPEPVEFLTMQIQNASGKKEMVDTVSITFPEPVPELAKEAFRLELKQDTLWTPAEFSFLQDSLDLLKFYLLRTWRYEEEYRLTVDSASIRSIYGKWNDASQSTFQLKSRNEYGHLNIRIPDVTAPAFVELLSAGDAVVRKAKVEDGDALFMNLNPNKYYARLILDVNENGIWDTGNYAEKRQPEAVFYSTQVYQIYANFEIEETWYVSNEPLIKQKPLEITKNKPKDAVKKKRNHREEGRSSNRSGSTGGFGSGLGF